MTITDKQAMREKFEAWAIDGLRGVAAAWAFADPRALFNMQGGEGRTYYIDDVESAFRGYCAALESAEAAREAPAPPEAYAHQARFWIELYGKEQWSQWQSITREQHEAVQRGESLYNAKAESIALYTTPVTAHADARDGGRVLLRQAIDAMSKLRQSLEFPGKHGGLYVFPEHAVRKFTDEQARLMYEEKRLAGVAQECVTDSDRIEFVMRKFPGYAARDAGITWSANTIDDYRAAIDRAMGGE